MSECASEARKTELLEELAALEHEQWRQWAMAILDSEEISKHRSDRWLHILKFGNYRSLPENIKDKDRDWAERVLWIVKKHLGLK